MHSNHPRPSHRAGDVADGEFAALALDGRLLAAVRAAGYDTPTPIQRAAIPIVLSGADLIGCAQTGTGKTAAFALPILHGLLARGDTRSRRRIRVLVLAPTRELAAQIGQSFTTYARTTAMRTLVVFGGVNKGPQVRALAQVPDILVATPGRLLDLLGDRALSLSDVECVVLDEADRMLDMGFIHDVRRILGTLPERRQTLLFSATMPREIESLAAQFLRQPQRVAVDPVSSTREPIEQSVRFVEKNDKPAMLIDILRDSGQALVFTRTKHGANKVARQLSSAGISAAAIHGNKSQSARETALADFKSGRTRIVVATDLASRGLDIKELPLVVNFDLPNEPEVYVHRVGRTGRAGAAGSAVSFCSREELPYLGSIERLTQRRLVRLGPVPAQDRGASTDTAPAARSQRPGNDRRERRTGAAGEPRQQRHQRQARRDSHTPESTPHRDSQHRRERHAEGAEAARPRHQHTGRDRHAAATPHRDSQARSDRGAAVVVAAAPRPPASRRRRRPGSGAAAGDRRSPMSRRP